MSKIKDKIIKLTNLLNSYSKEYYENNNSIISDSQFDALISELKLLEKNNPDLVQPNSPTLNIYKVSSSPFQKVKHQKKMLSLDNAFSFNDLNLFNKKIKRFLKIDTELLYCCELKIDGLSLCLQYNNGELFKALTRGDGEYGEDVTENILNNKSIKKIIPEKNYTEIRGEIVLLKDDFIDYAKIIEEINKLSEIETPGIKQKHIPANSRNASSGLLRSYKMNNDLLNAKKDSSIKYYSTKIKYLNKMVFFPYSIHNSNMSDSQSKNLETLKSWGYKVDKHFFTSKIDNYLFNKISEMTENRHKLNFDADGIVIKINNFKYHHKLGETSKSPRWAIAYKYPEKISETKLEDIFVTIGRTGRATYNAKLHPVLLEGSTISSATLHNYSYIEDNDIRINDIVKIKKAGGIIPKVIEPIISKRNHQSPKFLEQKLCPSCGSTLYRFENEVDQYCINKNCPSIILSTFIHFASKDALDINGLGEKIIKKFLDNKIFNKISDIYMLPTSTELQENCLKLLSKTKILSDSQLMNNLINSIENAKQKSLEKLLIGLNIRFLGSKNAEIIAEAFENIDNIMNASLSEIESIKEIGHKTAKSVYDFFKIKDNQRIIESLKDYNVNTIFIPKTINKDSKLYNKKILFTGTFSIPRTELKIKLKNMGAIINSSISKNLDILFCGKNPGSKQSKAKELNIKILNEEELLEIIKEYDKK